MRQDGGSIPVYLVNARLSDRSEERYRRLRWLVRPLLQEIDLVFAQDQTDVARLTQAGFRPGNRSSISAA